MLALHHAGRTPREIVGLLGVSRDQIYGILNYRGLVACPDGKNESIRAIEWRNSKKERETDALCESGEVDRQALAFRIAAMGGTAQMIAVEIGCELSLAEKYVRDCPPGWMTFRD